MITQHKKSHRCSHTKGSLLPWQTVWNNLLLGKSFTRIALNYWVGSHVKTFGRVCDVGGGRTPSYSRFVSNRDGWVIVDVEARTQPSVVSAVQTLPFQAAVFDNLLCFNVLEHVYEIQISIREMFRVLRPGGRLFIFVPFLVNVHPDPYDYHRYTGAALERVLSEVGFEQIEVTVFFGIFSSLLNLGLVLIPFRTVRAVIGLCTMALDALLYRLKPTLVGNYVIAYAVDAKKPN